MSKTQHTQTHICTSESPLNKQSTKIQQQGLPRVAFTTWIRALLRESFLSSFSPSLKPMCCKTPKSAAGQPSLFLSPAAGVGAEPQPRSWHQCHCPSPVPAELGKLPPYPPPPQQQPSSCFPWLMQQWAVPPRYCWLSPQGTSLLLSSHHTPRHPLPCGQST